MATYPSSDVYIEAADYRELMRVAIERGRQHPAPWFEPSAADRFFKALARARRSSGGYPDDEAASHGIDIMTGALEDAARALRGMNEAQLGRAVAHINRALDKIAATE